MARLELRLSDDLLDRFDRWARDHGGRSAALRAFISKVSGAAPENSEASLPRAFKVTLWLAGNCSQPLAQEALTTGMSRSGWASALVQHRLSRRLVYARRDEIALIAIQNEYRRIGHNLNQIARDLARGEVDEESLGRTLDYLKGFKAELGYQLESLRQAIESRHSYWASGR